MKKASKPTPEWHPALPENRLGRYRLQDEARKAAEAANVKIRRRSLATLELSSSFSELNEMKRPVLNSSSNGPAIFIVSDDGDKEVHHKAEINGGHRNSGFDEENSSM